MAYTIITIDSESDEDAPKKSMDEKKRKRMISNRESARRSRMKRQKQMEDLITEKAELERKLYEDDLKYNALLKMHVVLELENKVLKAKENKLTRYLIFLHQMLQEHREITDSSLNNDLEIITEPKFFEFMASSC
ncbi:bZIP transcription factor 53-like [Mercurialis annua]|uniref:bZIP transcription factor 53-like n=1 Tax=Mercurialis annua TaxID=3986 RepID=UPI00215F858B|nr:bZIP transcription factor 53-like [Mercurialis annua]